MKSAKKVKQMKSTNFRILLSFDQEGKHGMQRGKQDIYKVMTMFFLEHLGVVTSVFLAILYFIPYKYVVICTQQHKQLLKV